MRPGGRARKPEDKGARREQIKDAARALLDEGQSFSAIAMGEVMARAALSKGVAYLYFPTKEALFLEILMDDLDAWFGELEAALAGEAAGPAVVAGALAGTLCARPRLLGLLTLLHAVLEENLDLASARAFKQRLSERLLAADAALLPHLPGFAPGEAARLLLYTHALVVGLVGMSRPSPAVAEALADPALAWMRVALEPALREALAALLGGWSSARAA